MLSVNSWRWLQRKVMWFPVKEKWDIFALLPREHLSKSNASTIELYSTRAAIANTKLPSYIFAPLNLSKVQMYFYRLKIVFFNLQRVFLQIAKCISKDCKMYFYKLQNLFLQIAKCIFTNCKIYFFKFQNVFLQIAYCIY